MDAFALPAEQAALSSVLADVSTVPRTLVLVTVAVPIVVYGLMPRLHRLRVCLLVLRAC